MIATQPVPLRHQPNVIFIPESLRVCGNCHFWLGPRVRNGRFGFAALSGVAGSRCNRTPERKSAEALPGKETPLSNSDCPIWSRCC